MKKDSNKAILIDYLQDILKIEDLKDLEDGLSQEDILLDARSHKPQYMNGLEEMFAQIQIFCSSELVFAIGTGILGSGIYDVLKVFLRKIYNKLKNVFVTKIQSDKMEEIQPTIHFIIGDVKVILPLDIDNEKYEYFIDKLFESMHSETISKKEYCVWNKEKETIEYYSRTEIARKEYIEKTKNE